MHRKRVVIFDDITTIMSDNKHCSKYGTNGKFKGMAEPAPPPSSSLNETPTITIKEATTSPPPTAPSHNNSNNSYTSITKISDSPNSLSTTATIQSPIHNQQYHNLHPQNQQQHHHHPHHTSPSTMGLGTGGLSKSTTNPNITTTNIVHTTEPRRRVSIASDPAPIEHGNNSNIGGRYGYDNLAFEQNPKRKVSQTSMHSHSEIGPVRKKSILVNSGHDNESIYSHNSNHSYDNKQNGGRNINPSHHQTALDALHQRLNEHSTTQQNNLEQSWIFSLCLRCRVEDVRPSWEPPHWQKVCPYPLCPSFRQFARIISLILIGVLTWIVAYVIIGKSAGPGGQLFQLVVLTVAAHLGGILISLANLPRLIGMLLVGILFQNIGWVDLDGDFTHVTSELRKLALTLILIRAGLEMEPEAFKKVWKTILKLGVIPWTVECCVSAIMSHFLLDLPWVWSFLLGSIIAAVSPAVVVPCLFRLRTKGYGVAKGIPTLVIAVAGIDDALSVAIFGIIISIMFSSGDNGNAYIISQAPVCIIGGLLFGILWGVMACYIPEKGDSYVIPLRTIMLLAGGAVSIYGSEIIGYEGAGPLGVVFAAFISNYFWCQQGWEIEDNPVSTAFEIFWMIFEPILFGITGTTIKIFELEPELVYIGVGIIATGSILRILATAGIAFGDRLNVKEKFFVALSWMAKATVQAALGPAAMKHLKPDSPEEEKRFAKIVQTIAVLSIVLTAPLGAILISISGTKLLKKTRQPQVLEGWRRSHRPSMRDISIIDEEEEREDPESSEEQQKNSAHNTSGGVFSISSTNPTTFSYTK